ncbi:MAG: dTDP-glucose 4,6-dehydratase [candidate division Zixibacteria bacterium]|nr:dTDP-glucose 4,6-dehydratase [candidate division Zixibacteria bacterium]
MFSSQSTMLVTGGAGFIGSNFIHYLFRQPDFEGSVVNFDKLTYAGNLENLSEIEEQYGGKRYLFEKGDICDSEKVSAVFAKYGVDTVVNFAAESHVDRSIHGPAEFIQTNIVGTFTLLEAARASWAGRKDVLFHHVSTDEVFGSLGESDFFHENTSYDPRSPYSASKAASDHLVSAYFHTYGLPVTISNCSNNYGPYHFPEKLIPLMILNMQEEKLLPVYGDGKNIRDWLFVEDHCSAIYAILKKGQRGETYNIGGENEWTNINLVNRLCEIVAEKKSKPKDHYKKLINYVNDRPGHDRRYAINCDKIKNELGWKRSVTFEEGLDRTVSWYLANLQWIDRVKSGAYRQWIEKNYEAR